MPEPLTIQFATLEDRRQFLRFVTTAQECDGTPGALRVSLACIALKGAKVDDPTENEERERGETIAAILQLKQLNAPNWDAPRYHTEWGSKTAVGLARTLGAILSGALPR